jgi:hypothetical protein
MLRSKPYLLISFVALALMTAACTSDNLDDGGSADVVLEIESLENPAITATLDSTTGFCNFTITDWSFGAINLPKNTLALESGFNDISLTSVTITYDWVNPALSTPMRVIGLGGIVVPVGESATLEFLPMNFDDLNADFLSSSAGLTMRFEGRTVEGSHVQQTVLRQLNIEGCF